MILIIAVCAFKCNTTVIQNDDAFKNNLVNKSFTLNRFNNEYVYIKHSFLTISVSENLAVFSRLLLFQTIC